MSPARPGLIFVDWGSTHCRVSLLSAGGTQLDHRDGGGGVLSRPDRELAVQLRNTVEPWRACHGLLPVIVSGMAGSRHGLAEVPYLDCPASLADLASALKQIDPEILPECWIVPGLIGSTPHDLPDVMRGEEVQIYGLLEQLGRASEASLIVLPGTHSKWVLVKEGKVRRFATSISGELYTLLRRLGSLAALAVETGGEAFDRDGFLPAVSRASQPGGLLHHLFGLRVGVLLGEFPPEELPARLSALILGHEIEAMLVMFPDNREVTVVGNEELGPLYRDALVFHGIETTIADSRSAGAFGAARMARMIGLVA